jgi:hypothetical protein
MLLLDFYSNKGKYTSSGAGGSSSSKADSKKLTAIFDKFVDKDGEDPDAIEGQNLAAFFGELGIDVAGPLPLALAWQYKCKNFATVERSEFTKYYSAQGIDTLAGMKNDVKRVEQLIANKQVSGIPQRLQVTRCSRQMDWPRTVCFCVSLSFTLNLSPCGHCCAVWHSQSFKDFYRWLFEFVKEEEERKTIGTWLHADSHALRSPEASLAVAVLNCHADSLRIPFIPCVCFCRRRYGTESVERRASVALSFDGRLVVVLQIEGRQVESDFRRRVGPIVGVCSGC